MFVLDKFTIILGATLGINTGDTVSLSLSLSPFPHSQCSLLYGALSLFSAYFSLSPTFSLSSHPSHPLSCSGESLRVSNRSGNAKIKTILRPTPISVYQTTPRETRKDEQRQNFCHHGDIICHPKSWLYTKLYGTSAYECNNNAAIQKKKAMFTFPMTGTFDRYRPCISGARWRRC